MTARQLLARQRALLGDKYTPSVRDFEAWLDGLVSDGVLDRQGDTYTPTPLGSIWLSGCFPMDGHEAVAA